MILEAAKSIAAATSALIKAASAAQRELITSGKVSRTPLTSSDDGQWSEGLVSAAKMVAAATHSLVESANSLVQGCSSEEKLISSAKQVASSTAQLLVSCKVKADPDSESTKRLQAAGNAVKRATDNLVRSTQQAIQHEDERSLVLNRRIVGGIAQEINARSEVLRIERELEEARGRLTAIRQAKYKNRGDLIDTDNDAHQCNHERALGSDMSFSVSCFNCSNGQSCTTRLHTRTQSSTQNTNNVDRSNENLISPEKVSFTQHSLKKLKTKQLCNYNSFLCPHQPLEHSTYTCDDQQYETKNVGSSCELSSPRMEYIDSSDIRDMHNNSEKQKSFFSNQFLEMTQTNHIMRTSQEDSSYSVNKTSESYSPPENEGPIICKNNRNSIIRHITKQDPGNKDNPSDLGSGKLYSDSSAPESYNLLENFEVSSRIEEHIVTNRDTPVRLNDETAPKEIGIQNILEATEAETDS